MATAMGGCAADNDAQRAAANAARLVTGRSIPATMPVVRQNVGSLPMNVIEAPDRRWAIVSDMGYRQSLSVIDLRTGKRTADAKFQDTKKFPTRGLYYGLAISTDNVLYAAEGADAGIAVLKLLPDGTLKRAGVIATGKNDFPAGLALDGRGYLFATSNAPLGADRPFDTPGTLTCFDTETRKPVGRLAFDSYMGTTNYPLAVAATADGKVFVASQRDACVYVVDAQDPAALKIVGKIETGAHPAALLIDAARERLFVANAGSDTVSIVDARSNAIKATVLLRPDIARHVAGVTPLGMSLAPDGKTLYVALGDLNAVGVIDVGAAALRGYVPAGWYPSAVATDGKNLLVADAKGTQTLHPNPPPTTQKIQSPNTLLEGDVITRPVPTPAELTAGTAEVLELARLTPRYLRRDNPLAHVGVKHVIYIVKENRTYDQVLGDLPQGNGDPSRCIFGREVTPNLHALAERFVLLDNFYDCGEVSGDGWVWSTQAMANEYVIKNVPYQYSGRGRLFDYEGTNNGYPTGGFPAKGPDGKPLSEHPILSQTGGAAIPDVAEAPGGHLWDLCRRRNVGFRNYGFFVAGGNTDKNGKVTTPENYPAAAGLQPGGHDLAGLTDLDYRRFDLEYADSDAPEQFYKKTGDASFLRSRRTFGQHDAPSRFTEWKTEFDQMLVKDPTGAAVPGMMFVRFGNDHTQGMSGGKHTPRSQVADNDYAVGQLVEAVSHSPIWKDTAIFVIEDDAQNGPDHVDAHRSTCYVISPWVKKSTVDHAFHNTVSCVRTMELLLGLPPMNAYDATAEAMAFFDTSPRNDGPFVAVLPNPALLTEKNPAVNKTETPSPETRRLIEESDRMNFAIADKAPADRLTAIIWASVRGSDSVQPPTPHGPALLNAPVAEKDDDDD